MWQQNTSFLWRARPLTSALPVDFIFFAGCQFILGILIIGGNSLALLVIYQFKNLHTFTNYLVFNLTVADLCVGLSLPFHAALFLRKSLLLVKYVCFLRYSSVILPCCCSITTLLAISVDRFIAIVYPLHYFLWITSKVIGYVIFFINMYSLILALIPIFGYNRWFEGMDCQFEWVMKLSYIFFFGLNYFFFSSIMIIFYCFIFRVAWQQQKKIWCEQKSTDETSNISNKKSVKFLATVLGGYLFCWTPFISCSMFIAFGVENKAVLFSRVIFAFLAVINSAINPIIYGWKDKTFRKSYKEILGRFNFLKPKTHNNGTSISRIRNERMTLTDVSIN